MCVCVCVCVGCVWRGKCFFKLFSFSSFPSLLLPSLICTLTCSPWVDDFFLHYASTAADTPLLDLQVTLFFFSHRLPRFLEGSCFFLLSNLNFPPPPKLAYFHVALCLLAASWYVALSPPFSILQAWMNAYLANAFVSLLLPSYSMGKSIFRYHGNPPHHPAILIIIHPIHSNQLRHSGTYCMLGDARISENVHAR